MNNEDVFAGRMEGEGGSGGTGEGDALPGGNGRAVGVEGEVRTGLVHGRPEEASGGKCDPGVGSQRVCPYWEALGAELESLKILNRMCLCPYMME